MPETKQYLIAFNGKAATTLPTTLSVEEVESRLFAWVTLNAIPGRPRVLAEGQGLQVSWSDIHAFNKNIDRPPPVDLVYMLRLREYVPKLVNKMRHAQALLAKVSGGENIEKTKAKGQQGLRSVFWTVQDIEKEIQSIEQKENDLIATWIPLVELCFENMAAAHKAWMGFREGGGVAAAKKGEAVSESKANGATGDDCGAAEGQEKDEGAGVAGDASSADSAPTPPKPKKKAKKAQGGG